MIFESYLETTLLFSVAFGILGGVLKIKHRSPLSKVPTTKEEIERIEFEKYYELSNAQLTDIGDIMEISKRLTVLEEKLNIQEKYLSEENLLIGEEKVNKLNNLEIDEEYKLKLRKILALEAKNYTEEEICVEAGITKGEVELLKQLLDA